MIASLRGRLAQKNPQYLILDVGGVGYRVFISLNTYYKMGAEGEEVKLFIYTVVREDVFHLYGFLSQKEKEAFEKLISVSGIGPHFLVPPVEEAVAAVAVCVSVVRQVPLRDRRTGRLKVDLQGTGPGYTCASCNSQGDKQWSLVHGISPFN